MATSHSLSNPIDRLLRFAQHRRLDVLEVVGRIDDARELIGALNAPARLAGSQQSIVAHVESLSGVDGPART